MPQTAARSASTSLGKVQWRGIGQAGPARAISVHQVDLKVPATLRVEGDLQGSPGWRSCGRGRWRRALVGRGIWRALDKPAWESVSSRVIGQAGLARTVRVHQVDSIVPVAVR